MKEYEEGSGSWLGLERTKHRAKPGMSRSSYIAFSLYKGPGTWKNSEPSLSVFFSFNMKKYERSMKKYEGNKKEKWRNMKEIR